MQKPKFKIGDKVRPIINGEVYPGAEGTILGLANSSLEHNGPVAEVYRVQWRPLNPLHKIINFWLANDLKLLYNGVERAIKRAKTKV